MYIHNKLKGHYIYDKNRRASGKAGWGPRISGPAVKELFKPSSIAFFRFKAFFFLGLGRIDKPTMCLRMHIDNKLNN